MHISTALCLKLFPQIKTCRDDPTASKLVWHHMHPKVCEEVLYSHCSILHILTYTHTTFWGSLASSCQCRRWQTGFCCVCQRKWSGIDLRDSLTEHWTGEERSWEREEDTDKQRENQVTDRNKEMERERSACIYSQCVCVCVSWRGFKLPQAKPRVKMAGLENSLLLGKQDKTTSPTV